MTAGNLSTKLQKKPRQQGKSVTDLQATTDVIVDGQPVGAWYVAGNNPFDQWRDTDFLIPPTATAGKTTITVTLRFVSSSLDWNEFTYWAYTITQ